jgi:hypothetical protein
MVHRIVVDIPEDLWTWMKKNVKKGNYSAFMIGCAKDSAHLITEIKAESQKEERKRQFSLKIREVL